MIRKIIAIDERLCNGCGLCADACHEGAIVMRNGKAVLLRDDYCDGLGDCLPACPENAIGFVEREALPYDEAAVLAAQQARQKPAAECGCAGSAITVFENRAPQRGPSGQNLSALRQWPVQIKLVPVNAPFFSGADLLVAADCTAFAHGDFHAAFMSGKVVLVGCPKLDDGDYTEKLAAIIAQNAIRSVTVVRMSVPCCGGLERAVAAAVGASGKKLEIASVSIAPDGTVVEEKNL